MGPSLHLDLKRQMFRTEVLDLLLYEQLQGLVTGNLPLQPA
ncbi:hypothetical protein [Thermogemmatispora tikiterensis]|nr:hypothetical protein [Thermogemmatispora tikiterensis]